MIDSYNSPSFWMTNSSIVGCWQRVELPVGCVLKQFLYILGRAWQHVNSDMEDAVLRCATEVVAFIMCAHVHACCRGWGDDAQRLLVLLGGQLMSINVN